MNNLIDDQELQRLLDGVLPNEDRALLLQFADDYPANWRRIAMSFIEEQVLRNELTDLATSEPLHAEQETQSDDSPHTSPRVWTRVLAQAAVLCVMLGAAVWVGRTTVDQKDEQPIGKTPTGDYTIVLSPQQPLPVGLDQPFAKADTHNQDALEQMLTPLFDQQSQGVFRDHGYTVKEEPVIYVVHGQQGEQYVVPHRNVSFVAHHE